MLNTTLVGFSELHPGVIALLQPRLYTTASLAKPDETPPLPKHRWPMRPFLQGLQQPPKCVYFRHFPPIPPDPFLQLKIPPFVNCQLTFLLE